MKTAVIFYSLDGSCSIIAEEIKTLLNADLIRLYTKDDKKRGKIAKFLWALCLVFSGKKPPLKPYTFDASAYDLLVIGTPIWASSPAPPLLTFLSETEITGKKIALFACHAGGMENALDKLKTRLDGNSIIARTDFNTAKTSSEEIKERIADWVKGLNDQ